MQAAEPPPNPAEVAKADAHFVEGAGFASRHAPLLGRAYREAVVLHGSFVFPLESFVPRVADSVARLVRAGNPGSEQALIASLALSDLYLAASCGRGDDRAWRRLLELHEAYLMSVAHAWRCTNPQAIEIAASLSGELYAPRDSDGVRPIDTFGGLGSLRTWLKLVLVSRLARPGRGPASEGLTDETAALLVSPAPSPREAAAASELQSALSSALRMAFSAMSPRDRLIVKLHYLDELRQNRIAIVLGISESAVSRRLDRAHALLRRSIVSAAEPLLPGHDSPRALLEEIRRQFELIPGAPMVHPPSS